MSAPMFVVILDKATADEIAAVHELIKTKSTFWWHHFSTAWIAAGLTAKEWRDLIRPALPSPESSVLILALPKNGDRTWSLLAPKAIEMGAWFHRNYT